MRTKYKPWAKPFLDEHLELSILDEELSTLDNVYLEIGSGKGDFLVNMAVNNPDKFFLGIEKNVTCAGISAKKLFEKEIKNAKLLYRDGQDVVKLLKDKSVAVIFLNFSDPWPKKRHHKRRLTSSIFLEEYRRILKDDGKIIFKTDNIELFNYSLEMFSESHFSIINKDNNYDGHDPFDAQTEYETSFRSQGIPINRAIFIKQL